MNASQLLRYKTLRVGYIVDIQIESLDFRRTIHRQATVDRLEVSYQKRAAVVA